MIVSPTGAVTVPGIGGVVLGGGGRILLDDGTVIVVDRAWLMGPDGQAIELREGDRVIARAIR